MSEIGVLKNMSLTNLLTWLILKEKIKELKQQQKWTGESIVGLERCQEDYDNVGVTTVQHARRRANEDLRAMNVELSILGKHIESIEKEVMENLGIHK